MTFGTTNGNGNGAGDGKATDYTPIWPMVPGTREIGVTINGQKLQVEEGQTILQACRVLGIEVPTLCYEPKLAPYGACRICVVEVEGQDDTPISCGTDIAEGMVITTHSDRVIENRRMVLELIFSDHDAYCLPPCQFKCPTRVDIPGYLKQNTLGNWEEATRILKRSLPFPAILGRVCPAPCETHCRREEVDTAIAIRDSHRYCADRVLEVDAPAPIPWPKDPPTGRNVAIIGSGPAGMTAAYYLQLRGHHCDVFEADPEQGGMLRYGIPQYRLPKGWMDRELNHVWELGATFKPNMRLGRDFHLGDIIDDYDAIYVGIGCYKPNELGIDGEDANGTVNALENLYNSTRGIPVPRLKGARVVVIGGGFTAIDCTRTSVRQGAAEVTLVYRRDLKDMPAADEVHEAIEEGARVIFQAAPTRIVTDDSDTVTGVEFQRMKLGEPDEQGRRRPEPMPGTEFIVECDTVLGAIGQGPELSWIESEPEEIRVEARGQPPRHARGRGAHLPHQRPEDLRLGRRADRCRHGGRGHRRGAARVVRHGLLAARPRPRRPAGATDRHRAAAQLPDHRALHRRREGAEGDHGQGGPRGAAHELRRVRARLHRRPGHGRGRPLPAVHVRGDRPLRPARGGDRVRDDAEHGDRRALDPGQPVRRRQPRLRPRRDALASSCATTPAASTAADAPRSARRSSAPAATTSSARASTRSSPPPTTCRLNETPCVSCGRCAETCPVGALMPRPRILETYQLDVSRCIFCGICADACPYDALRCGPEFEFSEYQRDLPMLDILEMSDRERPTR